MFYLRLLKLPVASCRQGYVFGGIDVGSDEYFGCVYIV